MSGLRVISGTARGRKLRPVPGDITRPITDRTKESLFDIIGGDIAGASILDVFAGTGSVGIEALSRGAAFARFVDVNQSAIQTIKYNLEHTRLSQRAEVFKADAFRYLESGVHYRFDYIYIAPPQYKGMWARALRKVDDLPLWLAEDGWVIVQIHPIEYEPQDLVHLREFNQRRYGSTLLVFYEFREK
jgi:16S rRNA (guanine(966)-N(2))-methyltransferase RsmD